MPPAPEIVADMRNNVIANWKGGQGTNVECGAKANIVGNYYTNPGYSVNDQEQAIQLWADNNPFDNCPRGWAFIHGNVSADVPDIDNSPGILVPKETAPFPAVSIVEQDACSAARLVLQTAGHPIRDSVDQAIIARVKLRC